VNLRGQQAREMSLMQNSENTENTNSKTNSETREEARERPPPREHYLNGI